MLICNKLLIWLIVRTFESVIHIFIIHHSFDNGEAVNGWFVGSCLGEISSVVQATRIVSERTDSENVDWKTKAYDRLCLVSPSSLS